MKTISNGIYEDIEKLVTPRTLAECESDTLLLSMKVLVNSNDLFLGPTSSDMQLLWNIFTFF